MLTLYLANIAGLGNFVTLRQQRVGGRVKPVSMNRLISDSFDKFRHGAMFLVVSRNTVADSKEFILKCKSRKGLVLSC